MARKIVITVSGFEGSGTDEFIRMMNIYFKNDRYRIMNIRNFTSAIERKHEVHPDEDFNETIKKASSSVITNIITGFRRHETKNSRQSQIYLIPDLKYNDEFNALNALHKHNIELYHICVMKYDSIPEWLTNGIKPWEEGGVEAIEMGYESERSEYDWLVNNPKFFAYVKNDSKIHHNFAIQVEDIINRIWK